MVEKITADGINLDQDNDPSTERSRRKFSLVDAMNIILEFPNESEEARYARFPDDMPIWDKMKMERNALVGILSRGIFDQAFLPKVEDIYTSSTESVVLATTYVNYYPNLPIGVGEKVEFVLFKEMPAGTIPPADDNYYFYLLEPTGNWVPLEYNAGQYERQRGENKLEAILGTLYIGLFVDAVEQYLANEEDPEVTILHARYLEVLQDKKYFVGDILDDLLEHLDRNFEYTKRRFTDAVLAHAIKQHINHHFGVTIDYNYLFIEDGVHTDKDALVPGSEDFSYHDLFTQIDQAAEKNVANPEEIAEVIASVLGKYTDVDSEYINEAESEYLAQFSQLDRIFNLEDKTALTKEVGFFILEYLDLFFVDSMTKGIRTSPSIHMGSGFETAVDQINGIYFTADSIERRKFLIDNPEKKVDLVELMAEIASKNHQKNKYRNKNSEFEFSQSEALLFVERYLKSFAENVLGQLTDDHAPFVDEDSRLTESHYYDLFISAIEQMPIKLDQSKIESLVATNYHNLSRLSHQHRASLNNNAQYLTSKKSYYDPSRLSIVEKRKFTSSPKQQMQLNKEVLDSLVLENAPTITTLCPALPTMLIRDMFIKYQELVNAVKSSVV